MPAVRKAEKVIPDVYFHSYRRPERVVMQLASPMARWFITEFSIDHRGQTTFCGRALEPGGALEDVFRRIDDAGLRLLLL